jgi:hypothetical protein
VGSYSTEDARAYRGGDISGGAGRYSPADLTVNLICCGYGLLAEEPLCGTAVDPIGYPGTCSDETVFPM